MKTFIKLLSAAPFLVRAVGFDRIRQAFKAREADQKLDQRHRAKAKIGVLPAPPVPAVCRTNAGA